MFINAEVGQYFDCKCKCKSWVPDRLIKCQIIFYRNRHRYILTERLAASPLFPLLLALYIKKRTLWRNPQGLFYFNLANLLVLLDRDPKNEQRLIRDIRSSLQLTTTRSWLEPEQAQKNFSGRTVRLYFLTNADRPVRFKVVLDLKKYLTRPNGTCRYKQINLTFGSFY